MNENKDYQQSKCGPHSQVRQVPLSPIFQFPDFQVPLFLGSPVPHFKDSHAHRSPTAHHFRLYDSG